METSKKIIETIKEKHITPRPKWHFVMTNALVWLFFAICVCIGAMSFSIILFSIQQADFSLISHMSHSKTELFLGLFPFFWLVGLLVFLVTAFFVFQKSKKGYKFTWMRLFGFNTVFGILLGTLFFIDGGSQWLEETFANKVSYYESIHEKKMKIWMNPEDGFLSGTIDEINGDTLHLTDFNNVKWNIDYSDAFIPPIILLEKGEQLKLIGEIIKPNHFHVKEMRPWDGSKNQKRWKEKKRIKQ